ncbi:MAG: glycosyltransferase family 2 protein [Lachnospiraceae bacterium]|nr:glycosyltransferase family 2 protein [Lachnospiraceae bacterium]
MISIITVCYNEEKNIRKTIESVLNQKCKNFEYIIKDGKSTDCTNPIVSEYKKKFEDKGIIFKHIIDDDEGIYFAMNSASEFCNGEYLLFLNAGDILFNSTTLRDVVNKIEYTEKDIYYGDSIMKDEVAECLFKADMNLINRRMPFCHQACFIKRSLFAEFKYDIRYKICADYELILKLYERNFSFQNLEQKICIYDMNGISSTQFINKRKEHENILWEHGLNNCFWSSVHMLESYLKTITYVIVPRRLLSYMKKIYMKKIKCYEYWEGE